MALVEDFGDKFLAILLIISHHFLLSADGQEADRIGQYPQRYSSKHDVSGRGYEDISPIGENVHRANFKGYESHIPVEPTEMSLDILQSLMKSPQHDITSGEEPYDDDRRIDTDSELNEDFERTSSYFENIDKSSEYADDETTDDRPRPAQPPIANAGVERPDDNLNVNTKESRIDNHPKTITWHNDGPSLGHRRLRGVDKNGSPLPSFGYPRTRTGLRSPRREDFRQTSDRQAVFDRNDRPRLTEENYYRSNSNLPRRESRLNLRLGHPEINERAGSEIHATDGTDGRSDGNGYYRELEEHQVNWRSQPTEDRDVYLPHIMDDDDDYGDDDDYEDDDDDGEDSIYGRRMNSLSGLMDIPKDADVSMKGPGWTILDEPIETHRLPFTDLENQEGQSLNHEYRRYFGELDDSIAFEMPELHVNCWLQAMMATTWGFSPSCNEDGTYGPKQCHEKRCWCVDKFGRKVQQHGGKTDEGFYFGLRGLTLYCSEN